MPIFHRLGFEARYLFKAPWDSGIIAPELQAFIDGHPPGIALDMGCGTGTSSIALTRAGWVVTGVDFSFLAIQKAIDKSRQELVPPRFIVANLLHLPPLVHKSSYDLVLDIGCFHGLSDGNKKRYVLQLEHLLSPNGIWLLYGFFKQDLDHGPGLLENDISSTMSIFRMIKRVDGFDKKNRRSAWLWFGRG